MNFQAGWEWVQANPLGVLAIIVWLIANVAPRPHPDEHTGWKAIVWGVVDRVCILTAAALPGRFKLLFTSSPALVKDPPTPKPEDN